jgi:DNA polymerase type B, organellar and viral
MMNKLFLFFKICSRFYSFILLCINRGRILVHLITLVGSFGLILFYIYSLDLSININFNGFMEFVFNLQSYFVSGDYFISGNWCFIAANSYNKDYSNKNTIKNVRLIHTDTKNESENNKIIISNSNENQKIDSSFIEKEKNKDMIIRKRNGKKLIEKLFGATGYLSYKGFISLGQVYELLENDNLLVNNVITFLNRLKDDKVYTVLSVIRWQNENGDTQGLTMEKSMKLTGKNSPRILASRLHLDLISAFTRYTLDDSECELVLMYREWLDINEFNKGIEDIAKVIDKDISKEINKTLATNKLINNRLSKISINKYNQVLMDKYGTEIIVDNKVIGYKLSSSEGLIVTRNEGVNGLSINFVMVKEIINGKLEDNCTNDKSNLVKWTDTKTDNGFIREFNKMKLYFDLEGCMYKTEGEYYFPYFPISNIALDHDTKIGTLDFETYGNKEKNSFGVQTVYAGGWAVNNLTKCFYINSNESSEELVNRIIESIFNHPELNGYTFFAHNLGRFDSLFLIKALIASIDITIKPVWKDNKIISIIIKHNVLNRKIKLLDSMNFIQGGLRKILLSFNCQITKGYFPYSFVNKDNLFYIGNKPDIKYYENVSKKSYDLIPLEWNLKKETLQYLESDLTGLLEVMNKFSVNIFNEYNLNITKFKTLPALALGIFTSNFYDEIENLNIKMIKGKIEEDIRQSYFGGNVGIFVNEISEGFLYDINSQYPKAMLEDMPVGNPVYTTEKNLDNIFGFVFGKVTAPSAEDFRIPFIQFKDPKTGLVSCPRGEFYRMIFTEEIKYGIKHGYKFEILYGYQFKKGKLFQDFVDIHYENKKNAIDPIKKQICKLLLNSLYGKFGMKDVESILKVVSLSKANIIKKSYNYSIFAHLSNDKVLIRYSSRINETLRNLIKLQGELNMDKDYKMNEIGLGKNKGVNSAVHIASAISSYARIIINEYKNIPDNPCIMSDTDSVV